MDRIRFSVLFVSVVAASLVPAAIAFADAPDNDLLANSVVIDPSNLPFTGSVDTSEATSDADDAELGCPAPATDASVWYSITPTTDASLLVGADRSDYSVGISVASGAPGSLQIIECRPFPFVVAAEAGVTYHFQVFDGQEDGGGNGGNLEFTLEETNLVIRTQIMFSETEEPSGTFEVVDGADILGCTSGSFVDPEFVAIDGGLAEITKVLDCESGPRAGTISLLFVPGQNIDEPGYQTGPWQIEEGTEDFVGLEGEGNFSVVFDSANGGEETLAGSIDFAGVDEQLAQTGSDSAATALLAVGAILLGFVLVSSSQSRLRARKG